MSSARLGRLAAPQMIGKEALYCPSIREKVPGQTVGITEASPCYLSQERCLPMYYSLESKVTCNNYAERNRVDSHHTDLLSIVSPLLT